MGSTRTRTGGRLSSRPAPRCRPRARFPNAAISSCIHPRESNGSATGPLAPIAGHSIDRGPFWQPACTGQQDPPVCSKPTRRPIVAYNWGGTLRGFGHANRHLLCLLLLLAAADRAALGSQSRQAGWTSLRPDFPLGQVRRSPEFLHRLVGSWRMRRDGQNIQACR